MDLSRFYKTVAIEYDIEFLTPAFLGSAEGNAELRTAPFKAALRWWWRVLYGKSKTSEQLSSDERSVFGSTENGALVRISIEGEVPVETSDFPKGRKIPVTGKAFSINILDYLAYGVCTYDKVQRKNSYNRSYLVPGQSFKYSIFVPSALKNEIQTCLNALVSFGSVGSRSRNGFGSLAPIHNITPVDYRTDINSSPVEFPTLNSRSKLFVTKQSYSTWEDALSEIGALYRDARTSLENRHTFIKRGYVARPIEAKRESIPDTIRKTRSPKQFILHVGKQNGKYVGQILSLPIIFYEKNKQKSYDEVIDAVHRSFSKSMIDKTRDILKLMGVQS
jgi:CRISPR-associated protein Cmr1